MVTGCCNWCGGDVRVWQCLQDDAVRGGMWAHLHVQSHSIHLLLVSLCPQILLAYMA